MNPLFCFPKNQQYRRSIKTFLLTIIVCSFAPTISAETSTNAELLRPNLANHNLHVIVQPESGSIRVEDHIDFTTRKAAEFYLNANFKVEISGKPVLPSKRVGNVAIYQVPKSQDSPPLKLHYTGHIQSTNSCDWLRESCRLVNQRGVYLDQSSYWYPTFADTKHSFSMKVTLPEDWTSLSQGALVEKNHWQENHPQDAIYLLAGPFSVYESEKNGINAMVYLQQADAELADRYLQATHHSLEHYSELIGDYPYAKFATVESFWETGWGMPSFTLLGPRVLRLPFILYTSLPHEILHNWWGNSVFINPEIGNWSEGLTAYLADHAFQEQRATGADYRRDALVKYAVFANDGKDFPLAEFKSRHNNSTQAIGYSKSLMLFHMLRVKLGDDLFYAGLRNFFAQHKFTSASFNDIRQSFESVSDRDLSRFFEQWLYREGAPHIELHTVSTASAGKLTFNLKQSSVSENYHLIVPIELEFNDGERQEFNVSLTQETQEFTREISKPLQSLSVDPNFDVMRIPHPNEAPPSLNSLIGAADLRINSQHLSYSQIEVLDMWKKKMQQRGVAFSEANQDSSSKTLPTLEVSTSLPTNLTVPDMPFDKSIHSAAVALKEKGIQQFILSAPDATSLETLLRKMRHYGKYSYIVFDADTGKNLLKGQWPVTNSPLTWQANKPEL